MKNTKKQAAKQAATIAAVTGLPVWQHDALVQELRRLTKLSTRLSAGVAGVATGGGELGGVADTLATVQTAIAVASQQAQTTANAARVAAGGKARKY